MENKTVWQGLILALLWGALVILDAWVRPLIPSNELHHASIAWEMYVNKHFLVPIQTGQPYAEKTPFLYWLIHMGWFLFGINNWWIRLLPQLFMLGSLFITRALASRLFPVDKDVARFSPLILLGCIPWSLEVQITWFDMMIIFFITLNWYYLYLSVTQGKSYWLFLGLVMGGGLLAKGPVIFIFVLPPAILMPWWGPQQNWRSAYLKLSGAFLLSLLIFLSWALPAAIQGGTQYAETLFLTQSIGRIKGDHGPINRGYYYLQFLPVLILPWVLWITLWKSGFSYFQKKISWVPGVRFLIPTIFLPLFILSLFATKSYGYYFPCLPLIAILLAYLLSLSAPHSSRNERTLIALFYSLAGIAYLTFPYFLPPHVQEKFFWLKDLSPLWGIASILLGVFWFLWKEDRLDRLIMAMSLSSLAFCIFIQVGLKRVASSYNDWRPLSLEIKALQNQNIPVAFPRYFSFEELFEFYGRLNHPTVIKADHLDQWIKDHPNGWVIVRNTDVSPAQYSLRPLSARANVKTGP